MAKKLTAKQVEEMTAKQMDGIFLPSGYEFARFGENAEPYTGPAAFSYSAAGLTDRLEDRAIFELTKHERFSLYHDWAWAEMTEWFDDRFRDAQRKEAI